MNRSKAEPAQPAAAQPATKPLGPKPFREMLLESITEAQAAALIQADPASSARLIVALARSNTAALPDTVFVRRADGGVIKRFAATVTLRESEGQLIGMGPRDNRQYDFTIKGLRRLNEVAAIQIVRPDRVMVADVAQMNPYIEVNPQSRMPQVVYARCLAIGYSPMGTLVATDAMVRLDLNIYLLENLLAKLKRSDRPETLAEYGVADTPPADEDGKARPGQWRFFPVHDVGGIGLWVNLRNPQFQTVIGDHVTRLKFVERLAQAFAERNALKMHAGMPKAIAVENGTARVRVTGWTADFERADLDTLRKLVEQDRLAEFRHRDESIKIETSEEVGQVDDTVAADLNAQAEEQKVAERREAGEEPDEGEGAGEDREAKPKTKDDLLPRAMELFGQIADLRNRAAAKAVAEKHEITTLEEASVEQLTAFIKTAESELG